jgi:uncharacterized membrane-anchored protein
MIRAALYLAGILWLAAALYWLATRSETVAVEGLGYVVEVRLLGDLALITTLLVVPLLYWSRLRRVWHGREPKR